MNANTNINEEFEKSLTIFDLEEVVGVEGDNKDEVSENSAVFDEMVAKTRSEYEQNRLDNQGSEACLSKEFHATGMEDEDHGERSKSPQPGDKVARRHSSFESRQIRATYAAHLAMEKELKANESARAETIGKLLEFNSSINLASMSDLSVMNSSPSLHLSCPVLSYLNDDDEDSIEIYTFKKAMRRQSTALEALPEDCSAKLEDWETLNDGDDSGIQHREYSVSMNDLPSKEPPLKKSSKKRRPRSYHVLSERLSTEHPQKVLRSFGVT